MIKTVRNRENEKCTNELKFDNKIENFTTIVFRSIFLSPKNCSFF